MQFRLFCCAKKQLSKLFAVMLGWRFCVQRPKTWAEMETWSEWVKKNRVNILSDLFSPKFTGVMMDGLGSSNVMFGKDFQLFTEENSFHGVRT